MPPDALAGCDRILLIRPDNIGDVVLLAPAIRAIREAHRDAVVGLLASPAGATAVPLLPWIDEVLVEQVVWQDASASPGFDPKREFEFIERLRAGRWDAAVIFTSFSQTAFGAAYASYLAGIPVRAGHARDFGGALLSHAVPPPDWEVHQADRAIDLVEGVGIDVPDRSSTIAVPPPARDSVRELLAASGVGRDRRYILAVPGASCSARRYPPERYAAAAQQLHARTAMPVVVAGTRSEADRMESSFTRCPGVISIMGRTDIPELAALVASADLVLCGNSAALHLADALRRPVVTIYSGTELESQWRPRQAASIVLRRETPCSPCYRFECPYEMECVDIEPSEVADAGLRLLGVSAGTRAEEVACALSAS
jgi:ADP-heptose:LPS heptosyltransferase